MEDWGGAIQGGAPLTMDFNQHARASVFLATGDKRKGRGSGIDRLGAAGGRLAVSLRGSSADLRGTGSP